MSGKLMKCGCVAHGKRLKDNADICIVHMCDEAVEVQPNLENRQARCCYGQGHAFVPSCLKLAFFVHKPDKEYDEYYCGCYGWD